MTQVPGPPDHPHPGSAHPGYAHPGSAQPGYAYPGYAYPGYAYPAPVPTAPGPWPVVAAAVLGVFSLAVTAFAQAGGWLADQVLLATGLPTPAVVWPLIGLGNALLVGLPAMLLALVPCSAAVRATGRAWLVGAFALGGFGLLRAVPSAYHELYLLLLAALAAAGALGLRALRRRAEPGTVADEPGTAADEPGAAAAEPGRDQRTALLLAGAAGLVMLLPWVWFGALGGAVETVLAVAAAAAVGWYAAEGLPPGYWTAIGDSARGPSAVRTVLLGGTVAGVGLALLAAGVGQAGVQLAAIVVLPPVGYAAAAIIWAAGRAGGSAVADPTSGGVAGRVGSGPVAVLAALSVVGPLAFLDAEEVSLLLAMGRDLPFWAAAGAGAGLGLALALGLGFGFGFGRARAGWPRRWVAAATVAVVAVAGAAVYLTAGQPGLHGERLFVVMSEQADLSDVPRETGPAARDTRVREVYQRLVDTAETSQADLRRDLDRFGLSYTPYYLVNAIEVDAGLAVRAWLSRRADVDRVLVSQQLRPLPAAISGSTGEESAPGSPAWNLTMIGADRVWSQLDVDGAGIVVGSSDSGVDGSHPALADGFRGGDDSWFDPWNDTRTPTDNNGHGTHTLGSAVGATDIGVAPGASWVGCVNLDRNLGNPARYLDCLQFMLAPFPPGGDPFTDGRTERAPHVLTNSWGCPEIEGCDLDSLRPAAEALAAAGLMMVAAAGNTGPFCDSVDDPPAPYSDVLTIGAVDSDRQVTDFSSRGPTPDGETKPDLVAPGASVLSAMPGGGYAALDGTSMAAPHVAGVVALMWSANSALIGDVDRTTEILRQTAGRATTGTAELCGDPANLTGSGLVDAYAAVQAARSAG
ncbi:S8 family serine peptidase [Micromonospora sp. NBC_01813]|uniref:S8 family serine peptidase n=1 Tax=Micromonospora sp. NBC_01813 TaxID=2975988 RepID=UPI002DDC75AD|nr:S8 family serine peptidase [Micromonospora sp. NBC_01813]WSA06557.1 S8 family serine peptidase [Micromonospora sp. NBC_01813]